jgi:class 3 adenylate cyclase/CHASE2 domain-containing sensor protein
VARRRARLLVIPAIAAGSALLAGLLTRTDTITGKLLQGVEQTTLDWRIRSVPPRPAAESPVVLVLFDSASVQDWPYLVPFPRAHLAAVIDAVAAARPRAIGLDVYLDRRYPRLDSMDRGDERLRDALRRAGNVVIATGTASSSFARAQMPLDPYFAGAAAAAGSADSPTPYETIRDAELTVRVGRRRIPGFPLALWAVSKGLSPDSVAAAAERTGRLEVPGLPGRYARVPRDTAVQSMPIAFVGPPSRAGDENGAFAAYSSSAIAALGPLVPAEWFRGKIVLLGSGFHSEERFRTPFYSQVDAHGRIAGWTYGVETHANALDNLLTGRHPIPVPRWLSLLGVAALCLLVALASFRRGIGWGAAAALALVAGVVAAGFWAFAGLAVALPFVFPAAGALLAFLASTSYVSVVEGREKRAIRGAFSKYVPPAVVAELMADPARLKLGGEKRRITVLFTDLAGFTALSETVDPQDLLALLNRYLDAMTGIVLRERGTLDKYIGDAVMALYGAPTALDDHALHACRTAVAMQRRLRELNAAWKAQGWPELAMRVGINTGTPVVGNIGGKERFDYTALGDAVNLAARLEPACKTYGVGIMVSDETRRDAGDRVVVRELELLAVYGRAEPQPVYELVAMAGDDLGPRAELLAQYAKGLAAYRARDFEMALVWFQAALECDPEDGPAALYAERCRGYVESPPPAEWSFVERRQIK